MIGASNFGEGLPAAMPGIARGGRSRVRWAVSALPFVVIGVLGCGGRSGSSREEPKPIPECQAYEREMVRCTGQRSAISTQPATMPTSEERRQYVARACVTSLTRLKEACR
jgi:hypothetical protein